MNIVQQEESILVRQGQADDYEYVPRLTPEEKVTHRRDFEMELRLYDVKSDPPKVNHSKLKRPTYDARIQKRRNDDLMLESFDRELNLLLYGGGERRNTMHVGTKRSRSPAADTMVE